MTAAEFFSLLMAIYLAPQMPRVFGIFAGIVFGILAAVAWGRA